jgi:hypothetical protein
MVGAELPVSVVPRPLPVTCIAPQPLNNTAERRLKHPKHWIERWKDEILVDIFVSCRCAAEFEIGFTATYMAIPMPTQGAGNVFCKLLKRIYLPSNYRGHLGRLQVTMFRITTSFVGILDVARGSGFLWLR